MRKETLVVFDDAIWKKKVRDLARRVNVDESSFVKEQAGFLARDLAKFAPPYAGFPSANQSSIGKATDKKAGEIAILADLHRIFFVPDDPAIIDWAKRKFGSGEIWTKGKVSGKGVAQSVTEMEHHHKQHRNSITGRTKRVNVSERLWVKEKLFMRYYRSQKSKVGTAKSALAKVAAYFNPSIRVPAWVKRQVGKSHSSQKLLSSKNNPTAIFRASAFGLQHISGKTIEIVKRARLKAMEKRLVYILKSNAKKSGFKVR